MNSIFKSVALSLGAALLLTPGAAVAQPSPLPVSASAEDKTAAEMRASFLEGYAHQKAGRWADAERAYGSAWSKKKTHDVAANLGLVSMELKKYVQAADCFAFALRNYPAGGSPGKRTDMEQSLQQASAQVGRLLFTVNIEGSTIIVNGIDRGRSPLDAPVFVEPGAYTIEVRHPGYATDQRSGSIERGKTVTAAVNLSAEKIVPPMPTVAASTSATVPPPVPRSRVPAYVVGGVGVASVIFGGVLVGTAEGKRGEVRAKLPLDATGKPACGQTAPVGAPPGSLCDELRTTATSANTLGNTGIALFAIGGIAIAGAAVYWLWPSKPAALVKPASVVLPVIAADGGGLQWTGSF